MPERRVPFDVPLFVVLLLRVVLEDTELRPPNELPRAVVELPLTPVLLPRTPRDEP